MGYSKNKPSTCSEVKQSLLPKSNNAIAAADETNTEDTRTKTNTNTNTKGDSICCGFIFLLFVFLLSLVVFTRYIYIDLKFQVDSLDIALMPSGYKTNNTNNSNSYNGVLLNLTFSLNTDEISVFFESPTVSVLHQGALINSKTLDRFY